MSENQHTPSRILVIAAHPDDIEFGAAGSIARWTGEGAQVTYCIVTDGAAGSNDPNVKREDLIRIRREEQIAAAAVVGVHDVRFLGYPDGTLQHTLELRRDLTRLIRELRPYRVLCFDPTVVFVGVPEFGDYINHPDHRAAAEGAIYAVFPSAETRPIFPELLDEGLEPHHVTEVYMMLTTQTPNEHVVRRRRSNASWRRCAVTHRNLGITIWDLSASGERNREKRLATSSRSRSG